MKKSKKARAAAKEDYRTENPGNNPLLRREISKIARARCSPEEVKRVEEFISGRSFLPAKKSSKK